MKEKTFTIGITKNDLLIKATLSLNDSNEKPYYNKNTESYRDALDEEEGEFKAKEYLTDDTELWKMAVDRGYTTEGLDDWAESVLNTDGWQQTLDVQEYGNYWLEWDCIGCFEDNKKAEYQKLYISKEDFKTFFKKTGDIFVGSKEEKEILALFEKYSDQDDEAISEDFKKVL